MNLRSVRLWLFKDHAKIAKNEIFDSKVETVLGVEIRNFRNCLKRILAKFVADTSSRSYERIFHLQSRGSHSRRAFMDSPPKKRAPSGGAGAERRHTFVLQLRITTPHYGHLILQMAVYAL